jgi:cupin fold WbuC family metalloprotein
MSPRTKRLNEETLYALDGVVSVTLADMEELAERGLANERRRIRLCAHRAPDDDLHDMLIVHGGEAYVRPHLHTDKVESLSIIDGEADLVLFEEDGTVKDVIEMGSPGSGKAFFIRISEPVYHSLIIHSERLMFHEAATGPFRPEGMVFAPWSPEPEQVEAVEAFRERVERDAAAILAAAHGTPGGQR